MLCKRLPLFLAPLFLLGGFLFAVPNQFPESPAFPALGKGLIGGLTSGLSREQSVQALQKNGFLGYRELQSDLIKSPVRWGGFAYELTCKFNNNDQLELCLIQGEAGWQDFFYEDIVRPQWQTLRGRVDQAYGKPAHRIDFPDYFSVPFNDMGGLVTDRWELPDRTLMLTVQTYTQQDCCTRQVLDFSCCTLLIQPK
jgi:hypothetical protein